MLGDASCSCAQLCGRQHLPKLRFRPNAVPGVLRTRWVALYTFCRICSLWLWNAGTELPVPFVVEETVSSVELQQQHTGFGTVEENKFL